MSLKLTQPTRFGHASEFQEGAVGCYVMVCAISFSLKGERNAKPGSERVYSFQVLYTSRPSCFPPLLSLSLSLRALPLSLLHSLFGSHQHMLERTRAPLLTIYYSSFRRLCTHADGRSCTLQFVTRLAPAASSDVLLVTMHRMHSGCIPWREIAQWRENKRLASKEISDAARKSRRFNPLERTPFGLPFIVYI